MKKNIDRLYMVFSFFLMDILKANTNMSKLVMSILIVFLIYMPVIIETIIKYNK